MKNAIGYLLGFLMFVVGIPAILYPFYGCQRPDEASIRNAIEIQLSEYPESRVQDIYKSFCQDNLGPEHLIPDPSYAADYLEEELRSYKDDLNNHLYKAPAKPYCQVGDRGNYVRVDLSVVLDSLVTEEVFLDAFVRSANEGTVISKEAWVKKWHDVSKILRKDFEGLPDLDKDLQALDSLLTEGQYIMHHSQAFRDAYHPHYRIISRQIFTNELWPLIDSGTEGCTSGLTPFEMNGPDGPMKLTASYYPSPSDVPGCFGVISHTDGNSVFSSIWLDFYAKDDVKPGEEILPQKLMFGASLSSDSRNYAHSYSGKMILKEKTKDRVVIQMDDVHFSILHGEYTLNGDLVAFYFKS